jgi:hypothetical protein
MSFVDSISGHSWSLLFDQIEPMNNLIRGIVASILYANKYGNISSTGGNPSMYQLASSPTDGSAIVSIGMTAGNKTFY